MRTSLLALLEMSSSLSVGGRSNSISIWEEGGMVHAFRMVVSALGFSLFLFGVDLDIISRNGAEPEYPKEPKESNKPLFSW